MSYNPPEQLTDLLISAAKHKVRTSLYQTILLGIMAGAFIALGAQASSAASHTIASVGIAKTVAGIVFPIGLMLIVIVGGHLFTSSCMNVLPCMNRQTAWRKMLLNLSVVYLGNLMGATLIALSIYACGELNYSDGALGGYTIKIAVQKLHLNYSTAIVSGLLCNLLVCLAVVMAMAAKDIIGKIAAIFFPIFLFIISGFEHCVANMYYIPAGILASGNPLYVQKAMELYHVTPSQMEGLNYSGMWMANLIPVTIGNLLGGAVVVSGMLYLVYKKGQ